MMMSSTNSTPENQYFSFKFGNTNTSGCSSEKNLYPPQNPLQIPNIRKTVLIADAAEPMRMV